MGMGNVMFWSKIGSGFGEPGGTPRYRFGTCKVRRLNRAIIKTLIVVVFLL